MSCPAHSIRLRPSRLGFGLGIALFLSACGDVAEPALGRSDPQAGETLQRMLRERASALEPRDHRIGQQLPDLEFTDLDGRQGKLSDFADQSALVISLRDVGCPVSARIGPASRRLEQRLAEQGVALLFVNIAAHNTAEEMRGEIADFGFTSTYAVDPEGHMASALGATTTTDFFLLDSRRSLIYRGAADDQYGRGVTLPEPKQHFLEDALAALKAGRRPRVEATFAPGCRLAFEAPEPGEESSFEPTYYGEVSRIVQRNCVPCHRVGGAAPFPLDAFKHLKGRRGMVRYMLDEKLMPPWLASHDSGPFEGDRRMSEDELQTIAAWYEQGMPLGDAAQAPLPMQWHAEWVIGEPDFIFEDKQPFLVPAEGVVDLISTYIDVELDQDIWVDRIQVTASAPKVVHHSTVLLRFPDGHPNRSQAGLRKGEDGYNWRFFMAYLPGAGSRIYPQGMGRLIPKGSVLRVVTHYSVCGVETSNRMRIGVLQAETPPLHVVETRMLRQHEIEIPPGARDLRFDQEFRLPKDVLIYSVTPHMHYRGARYKGHLVLPDGTQRKLIEIPQWDQDWQFSFVYRDMVFAPKGSLIQYSAWYDNSVDNLANPDPTQTVRDGPQIWDEMMMMWIEWVRPRVEGE